MAPLGGFSAVGSSGGSGVPRKPVVVDAHGYRWTIEPCAGFAECSQLAQRRDVVENPERAAVSGDDEIVAVNGQIAHRGDRQVELQRLPVVAVVERNVNAEFGAGEEQALVSAGLRESALRKVGARMPSVIGCQVLP